ncbi:hypothetical protein [Streptomyces sp. NPDC005485]|uniref:hypothetical protein n=1 Tax=Streptomyces sp. NPDC005485 TaxID=3155591 RepID=UPI0033A4E6EF
MTYFEPLWQAAAQDTPAADDDHLGSEPAACDTTAPDGVFRLLAQFSGALRNGPELPPHHRVRRTIAERLAANGPFSCREVKPIPRVRSSALVGHRGTGHDAGNGPPQESGFAHGQCAEMQ